MLSSPDEIRLASRDKQNFKSIGFLLLGWESKKWGIQNYTRGVVCRRDLFQRLTWGVQSCSWTGTSQQWHYRHTVHPALGVNSSCLGKKKILLPDFPTLYTVFLEIPCWCKALGKKVHRSPLLRAWDLWTLERGQSLDVVLDISKSAMLQAKYHSITEKGKVMAGSLLQVHETLWIPCFLALAHRLDTFRGRRFSTTQKWKCSALVTDREWKGKLCFKRWWVRSALLPSPATLLLYPPFFLLLTVLMVSL